MSYIFLFILLIFLILLLIPFKIKIYYEFTNQSKYIIIITYLFGLIKKEIDSTNKNIKKNNTNKHNKKNIISIIKYLIDKGSIKKLCFRINIGFEDASLLGIAVGIIWAIVNSIFAYFFYSYDIDKINNNDIQVVPVFNYDTFELFFLCIIKVNLVYIITTYIRILKIRKGGDSIARTSNRRINEDYYE